MLNPTDYSRLWQWSVKETQRLKADLAKEEATLELETRNNTIMRDKAAQCCLDLCYWIEREEDYRTYLDEMRLR